MECPIAWTSRVHMNSQEGSLDPRGPCMHQGSEGGLPQGAPGGESE